MKVAITPEMLEAAEVAWAEQIRRNRENRERYGGIISTDGTEMFVAIYEAMEAARLSK